MKQSFNRAFDKLNNKGERPALAWALSILWLLLIGWAAFFWNLGSIGLVDETEPLFAEAARQMTLTGDWITPFFNGETRFDKPALIYWLMAIAYSVLGVNEWAVRLPSALSAMGLVSLGFYTLWRFGVPLEATHQSSRTVEPQPTSGAFLNRRYWLTAALGAALMALNPETIAWARTGVSDMLLAGCMCSALLSFFLAYAQPSKRAVQARWYLAFYVLIALAVLAKGPIGIVLPVLIIGSFLLYLGNWREVLREMRPVLGGFLFLAIALPWYVLVIQANGWAYINSFFGYHNLERFTGVVNYHSGSWYSYFLVVLIGFAPWSISLSVAIARVQFWKRSHWRSTERSTQLGLFALFWFICIFGFFTIAVTKRPSYVLPLIPAAAILVALVFSSEFFNNSKLSTGPLPYTPTHSKLFSLSDWLNVGFLVALAGTILFSPYLVGTDPAAPDLGQMVRQSGLPVLGASIWAITAVAGAVLLLRRQGRWLMGVNLVAFLAFLIFVLTPGYFLMDRARQLPLRQLSALAIQERQPGEELMMIGFPKPSVVFYTQHHVTYIGKMTTAPPDFSLKWESLKADPASVLVIAHPQELYNMQLLQHQYQNLGKAGAYQLIRVSLSGICTEWQASRLSKLLC